MLILNSNGNTDTLPKTPEYCSIRNTVYDRVRDHNSRVYKYHS